MSDTQHSPSSYPDSSSRAADREGRPSSGSPPTVVVHTEGGGWRRRLSWLGWAGFGFCALLLISQMIALGDYFDTTEGIQEKFHSGSRFARDKVAIITIAGVIMEGEGYVKRQIDRVLQDDNVKAVVVRVNSPGGTVSGSDYMYHHLTRLRQEKDVPLVVSMGSMATSGGYYVSMAVGDQEKAIFAEPTTTTGSIGVIIPHYDLSGLMERYDIKDDSIATHPRKQMLSMTRPMDAEQRELLKAYIDESFGRFKEIVKSGRPAFRENEAALDKLATGEIFTATQALKNGLVDELGFLEKAVDRALELGGLSKDDVRVVRFKRPASLLSFGGMAQSRSPQLFDLNGLLELSTPRAYYLWTTLPPLLQAR